MNATGETPQATIPAPAGGTWWLDDGADSGVWPCEVLSVNIFGVSVRGTHESGPYFGETITVDRKRVYDNRFNHPELGMKAGA